MVVSIKRGIPTSTSITIKKVHLHSGNLCVRRDPGHGAKNPGLAAFEGVLPDGGSVLLGSVFPLSL